MCYYPRLESATQCGMMGTPQATGAGHRLLATGCWHCEIHCSVQTLLNMSENRPSQLAEMSICVRTQTKQSKAKQQSSRQDGRLDNCPTAESAMLLLRHTSRWTHDPARVPFPGRIQVHLNKCKATGIQEKRVKSQPSVATPSVAKAPNRGQVQASE